MSRHLFRLSLAGALILLWSTNATASLTRLQSMGANPNGMSVGKSGQFIDGVVGIDDSTNIFTLPGTLALYPNMAIMDTLTWDDNSGATGMFGFHYALGEYTVMALYGGQGTSSLGLSSSTTAGGSATALEAAGGSLGDGSLPSETGNQDNPNTVGNLWFGALFAHDLGGIRLGLGVHTFSANNEITLPETSMGEASNWGMDVDLGLGLDFDTEDSMDFGLGLRFGSFTYTGQTINEPGNALAFNTPQTNIGFDLTWRGQFALFEGTELVPYAQIMYEAEQINDEFPRVDVSQVQPFGDFDHFGLELGTNLKIMPTEKIVIYPGIGFRMDNYGVVNASGTIDDDSQLTLPYYGFGVDARVWSWFSFRFGARQYVKSDTDGSTLNGTTDNPQPIETSQTRRVIDTELHTGFGLLFGENDEWRIDAHLSPAFFVKGPYILTGSTTTTEGGAEQMNASIALQYLW